MSLTLKCPSCGHELKDGDSFTKLSIGTIVRKGRIANDHLYLPEEILAVKREGDYYIPCSNCGDNIPEKNIRAQIAIQSNN